MFGHYVIMSSWYKHLIHNGWESQDKLHYQLHQHVDIKLFTIYNIEIWGISFMSVNVDATQYVNTENQYNMKTAGRVHLFLDASRLFVSDQWQQWGGNSVTCWGQLQFTDSVCLHMCPASLLPAVKRPVLISGCPGLSETLVHRQHNDDVTDSTAGHPGAPCSGWDSLLKTLLQDATRFTTMMFCYDGETLEQAAFTFFHLFSMLKKWHSSVWMLIIFL